MQLSLFPPTVENRKEQPSKGTKPTSCSKRGAAEGRRAKKRVLVPMTMEEVAKDENLRSAFAQVKKNRGSHGIDGRGVEDVERHLSEVLEEVQRSLLDGSYTPKLIRRVWIPKGDGSKRGLGIPTVIDRMVQQAVLQVLQPHFDPTFDSSSHGFRPGKSAHSAIAEAKEHVEAGYEWVVDLDLEKFFDTVNHQRLLAKLEERIPDRRITALVHRMVKTSVVLPDGVVVAMKEGTPQGGPLSPLLSNLVLDELDQELRLRGHRFVRYADDCNIYVQSKRAGERVMESVTRFIEKRMRLKVNQEKSAVAEPHERHFLGFRIIVDTATDEVKVGLSKRTKKRLSEKVKKLTPRNAGSSLGDGIKKINSYLKGWFEYFKPCTADLRVLEGTDAHIRRRLRARLLKQWKRKRVRLNKLIDHGVSRRAAGNAVYGQARSLWALSAHNTIHRALPNRFFKEQGLFSLKEERTRLATQEIVIAPVQMSFAWG